MRKSEIGKVLSFKFPKRKNQIQGLVLDYNQDWTLINRINDYSIDGFTIFRNDKVEYQQGEHDKFTMKIFKLKDYLHIRKFEVPIDSLDNILDYINNRYQLIQLDTKDGEAFDVVKYLEFKEKLYWFDSLSARAKWIYKLELPAKEIRYISFDNSYLNSLKLITKFKNSHSNKVNRT